MACEGEGRLFLSTAQAHTLGSMFFIISLFVICVNLLLLPSIIKTNQLDTTWKKCIFLLNLSDFCIGIAGISLYGVLFTKYSSTSFCELHKAAKFTLISSFYFSFCMMLLIALDRSFNIVPDFDSTSRIGESTTGIGEFIKTSSGFNFTASLSVFTALCLGVICIIDNKVTRVVQTIATVLACVMFTLLYIYFYLKIRQFTKKISVEINRRRNSGIETPKSGYLRRFQKPKKTVLILIGAVNLCLIPTEIMQFVGIYWMFRGKEPPPIIWFLYYLSIIPLFANSGFNAVIILCRNRKLKNCALSWLLKRSTSTVQKRSIRAGNTNTQACKALDLPQVTLI